jgi:hypothetical protein
MRELKSIGIGILIAFLLYCLATTRLSDEQHGMLMGLAIGQAMQR